MDLSLEDDAWRQSSLEEAPYEHASPPSRTFRTQLQVFSVTVAAILLASWLLQSFRPFDSSAADAFETDIQRRREIVWSNCQSLERIYLSNPSTCVSAYEFDRFNWLLQYQDVTRGVLPTFEVQGNWLSAYGLVLDFHASYPVSPWIKQTRLGRRPRRGIMKRTLKCSLGAGSGMSVVWDVLFRAPPLPMINSALHGENSSYINRTHETRLACPASPFSANEEEMEHAKHTSAVFNVFINCDKDIRRGFLGNPLGDEDFAVREQCQRKAWLWARDVAGIDVGNVRPWTDLCRQRFGAVNKTDIECYFGRGWQMEFGWRSLDGK